MSPHASILSGIDDQRDRMSRLVTEWASINSASHNISGLERCAASIVPELKGLGGEVRSIDLPPVVGIDDGGGESSRPLGRLIHVRKRSAAPVSVLLGIHYDTVYAADDPFQTVWREEDRLRGPGVLDAKGGIAVMLTALEAVESSPLGGRIGWDLFLNPDEEIGSPGSGLLIAEMARGKSAALLFEPALPDGSLVSGRKGSGNFAAVVTGRSAHAGRDPAAGRNAVHLLAEFVVAVAAMHDPAAGVSTNVGRIVGGGPVNVVPDLAVCRFNVRVTADEQCRDIEQRLADLTTSLGGREGFGVRLHGGFTAPPKPVDAKFQQLLDLTEECGKELGLMIGFRESGGVCDGNRVAAAGVPCVDSLGPRGGEIHSGREFLLLDSLAERAKLAALVMLRLAEKL